MATFDEIKELRLLINDPFGFIDFIQIATTSDLPAAPASQTAYKVTADGSYYETSLTAGATESDYERVELQISDSRLSAWLDTYTLTEAKCKSLKQIIMQIGKQLGITRNQSGTENVEYTSLKDMYEYYKAMYDMCKDDAREENKNSSGRWGGSKAPNIAGGNV